MSTSEIFLFIILTSVLGIIVGTTTAHHTNGAKVTRHNHSHEVLLNPGSSSEIYYKGRCTHTGTGTCKLMANGACESTPTSVASNMTTDKGVALYNQGNYTEAIKYYDKALAIQPNNTYPLYYKALALDSLGNHTGALEYYDKVLAMDPHDVATLTNIGLILANQRNYTGAIKCYDKALAIDACDSNALTEKGEALYNLGNYTGATSYHDKAEAALVQHLLGESCKKGLLHAKQLLQQSQSAGAISKNGTCSCSVSVLLPYMVDILAS
jgi:tetratricopeptide (TPR) repeat protein